jgi:hypothetical protein
MLILATLGNGWPAQAGLIVIKKDSISGARAPHTWQTTIMLEGNLEKIVSERTQIIVNLDDDVVYPIDAVHKTYAELLLPLETPPVSSAAAPAARIAISPTGKKRRVAGFECKEYAGLEKSPAGDLSIVWCVSTSATGTAEFSHFQSLMRARFSAESAIRWAGIPAGIALAAQSTIAPLGVVRESEVVLLRAAEIAPSEFAIPPGYVRREFSADAQSGLSSAATNRWSGGMAFLDDPDD